MQPSFSCSCLWPREDAGRHDVAGEAEGAFIQTRKQMENRMSELETENTRLQRLVVELLIKNQQLRDNQFLNLDRSSAMERGDLPIAVVIVTDLH